MRMEGEGVRGNKREERERGREKGEVVYEGDGLRGCLRGCGRVLKRLIERQ